VKFFAPVTMAVTMLVCSFAFAQEDSRIAEAKAVSGRWLELADAGNYGATWDQAASAFQAAVTRPDWESTARSLHAAFGKAKSRTVKSATYSSSLPGAPAGDYVVIQYLTQLEGGRTAVETVTPQRDKDGAWKVSGYYIK
jgi:hypothetical protein